MLQRPIHLWEKCNERNDLPRKTNMITKKPLQMPARPGSQPAASRSVSHPASWPDFRAAAHWATRYYPVVILGSPLGSHVAVGVVHWRTRQLVVNDSVRSYF